MRRRFTLVLPEPPDSRLYDAFVIAFGVAFVLFTLWLLFG
jgi:hypothetical protein